jgi:hypothetical protein
VIKKTNKSELSAAAHACNPRYWEPETEGSQFKSSLAKNLARPYQKIKQGMMFYICYSSYMGGSKGGISVQGHLLTKMTSHLKKRKKTKSKKVGGTA